MNGRIEAQCKTCKFLTDTPKRLGYARNFDMCVAPISPMPAAIIMMMGNVDIPYNRFVPKDAVDGFVWNAQLRNCACYVAKDAPDATAAPSAAETPKPAASDGPDPNLADMLKSFTRENTDVRHE